MNSLNIFEVFVTARIRILTCVLLAVMPGPQQPEKYDPLTTSGEVTTFDTTFTYGKSDRTVPLKIYLPEGKTAAPVLLFSHGLGGSREAGKYLGKHWAGRGYAVVVMQHPGSDRTVITNAPRLQRMAALKAAANGKNAQARYADVKATLDHITSMNQNNKDHKGRFDLAKVGMSGHSFGAVTTQAVSGQTFGRRGQEFTDKRIKAAVAFSPSIPAYGNNDKTFADVDIPWLLMTGTRDTSPIGNRTDPESRRLVFKQLPPLNQYYELVFEGGEHSAFSDERARGQSKRNPERHPAIQAISTAFWDAWLLDDQQAKLWLDSPSPRQLLDSGDVWQKK